MTDHLTNGCANDRCAELDRLLTGKVRNLTSKLEAAMQENERLNAKLVRYAAMLDAYAPDAFDEINGHQNEVSDNG